jgi:hypothetical protein
MAQAKIRMMPGKKSGLTSLPLSNYPQKSSATFIQGAPVKVASGVLAAVSTANKGTSSLITYVKLSSLNNVLGISQGVAVSGVTTRLCVAEIREGMEFVGNLVEKSASSAVASKVGDTVYMAKRKSVDTHWGWTTDTPGASSTSYVQGVITELIDPASTVNGRVSVRITVGGALSAL